jgi:hypothetical protein
MQIRVEEARKLAKQLGDERKKPKPAPATEPKHQDAEPVPI